MAEAPEGFLLLGANRSGTTLLRRMLDAHPAVAIPPETQVFVAAARFLAEQPMGSGARVGVRSGLAQAGFADEVVLGRLRELTFGFLREVAAREGKRLWGEKTPVNVWHLPAIEALCGERVRYVGMVRHGLDVAASTEELFQKTGGWFEEHHRYLRDEPRPLVALARAWADATSALLDLKERRPEQVHLLRYEALVADPEAELAQVLGFLGLPAADGLAAAALTRPGMAGFGDWKTWGTQAVHAESVGRYKRLDRAVVAAMAQVAGEALARAGYPPIETLDEERARKRAELAMRVAQLKVR